MTIATYLKDIPLFSQLPEHAFAMLAEQGTVLSFDVGELVFWEGDVSDAMYVILEGKIRVFKRDEDDNEYDINRQGQGECFGELALLDSQPRSASIRALTPCKLFRLEKSMFMSLLLTPETQSAAFSILSVLVDRVRELTEKYVDEQLAQRTLQAEMEAERHRSLAQMVAGVAHELNTPLGITNTAVDMIAKRIERAEIADAVEGDRSASSLLTQMQEAADLAMRNIERAHKLVENFKKISVSQLTSNLESVSLPTLIEDILQLFKINARQANLNIQVVDNLPEGQTVWRGNSGHLTQVLTNLLFNIERYAYPAPSEGQIVITLDAGQKVDAALFTITVQDFGVGISEEDLPQIFEPFFTTGRMKGGTGLGLAIVHNIVTEALGGTIEVESAMGKGTSFRLTVPQRLSEADVLSKNTPEEFNS